MSPISVECLTETDGGRGGVYARHRYSAFEWVSWGKCVLPLAKHGRWGTRLEVKSVKTETPAIVETEPGVDPGGELDPQEWHHSRCESGSRR